MKPLRFLILKRAIAVRGIPAGLCWQWVKVRGFGVILNLEDGLWSWRITFCFWKSLQFYFVKVHPKRFER